MKVSVENYEKDKGSFDVVIRDVKAPAEWKRSRCRYGAQMARRIWCGIRRRSRKTEVISNREHGTA